MSKMAACRKNIPIRESNIRLRISGGTMCRMPSPQPGPLRTEDARELLRIQDAAQVALTNKALTIFGASELASSSSVPEITLQVPQEKVA